MIYLSLLPLQPRRLPGPHKGWPQKAAWFSLRRWGTVINVAALIWGGLMLVNFSLFRSKMFGAFGTATYNLADGTPFALRDLTNPFINEYISIGREGSLTGLPAIPIFEAILLVRRRRRCRVLRHRAARSRRRG